MEEIGKPNTPLHNKKVLRRLEKYIFPVLGSCPINEVKPLQLMPPLRALVARGKVETAKRVRGVCSQVFRYGVALGLCEFDPAASVKELLPRPVQGQRAAILDEAEIGNLLCAIDDAQGDISMRYALRLMPYVFLRSSELRCAVWEEIDFEKALWTIPAARMKKRREHIVPLARQVVALLKELYSYTGDSKFLLPSPFSSTKPISDVGLLNTLRRLGYRKGEMDIHVFRSIASTHLNELGFDKDAIEIQLAQIYHIILFINMIMIQLLNSL